VPPPTPTATAPTLRAPLVPLAVAAATGIALGAAVPLPSHALITSDAALLLAAGAALTWRRHAVAAALLVAALIPLGALRARELPPGRDDIAAVNLDGAVSVEARLVEEPRRWAPDRARLLLDVEALVDGAERRPMTGRVLVTLYGEAPPLGEGQRVAGELRLHPPVGFRNPGGFDYPAQLRREGIALVGSARADRLRPLTADQPPWPARVKRWTVTRIAADLPETSAALLTGLLLGERAALPRDTDEAFRRAGVYHVLAVSGFNVALVSASVFALLTVVGVPRRVTAVAAAAALVGFALVVGGQASVVRATLMGLLLLGGVLLERDSQMPNALALAALLLLAWRPGDLWDPGFQLSFAATAGIVYLGAPAASVLTRAHCPPRLAVAVGVSAAAQAAVLPVMLAHFNQVSLIGPLANLLVVPLAGAATTVGLFALAAAPLSDLAGSLGLSLAWALVLLLRIAVWTAAAMPWALAHAPAPGPLAMAAWLGAAVLAAAVGTRWARRSALGLVVVGLVAAAWPLLAWGDGRLRVTFLDVGQGDAALVEVPGGGRLLVDGGPGGGGRFDVGERVVAPFLWNRGLASLDVVAVTHADADHSGGLEAVLRQFAVGEIWENGRWPAGHEGVVAALERARAPRRLLAAGQRLRLGEAVITVLNPPKPHGPEVTTVGENDHSLVLRLDWRGVSLILTGDLTASGEDALLAARAPLAATVLKVGHHGSRSSTAEPLVDGSRPRVAVVSVGARNPFRHPAPEVLARLTEAGARLYRTDRDGAVIVETDASSVWVTSWATGRTDRFDVWPPIAAW
jgi:competence protein ComEC